MMKTNVSAKVMEVSPKLAAEWLESRWGEQRPVREAHVLRLAEDMENGRFGVGPDAVLRLKGKLANGQHRLSAVVLSGRSQKFLVMDSDDEELYRVIDCGLRRTVSDALIGVECRSIIPTIARWVRAYDTGKAMPGARQPSEAESKASDNRFPSQAEMIEYCETHREGLVRAAQVVMPMYKSTRILPEGMGGAIYFIGARVAGRAEKTEAFLSDVYRGGRENAALDLRNRLIKERAKQTRIKPGLMFMLALKAFRATLDGVRPGALKWYPGEALPVL